MATVYLADDLKLDRQVALKVLRPELAAVLGTERFLAEVKITARLDHPHILTLIDSGTADGLLYYVLPFVRGESLRDLLDREPQLSVERALEITRHIGSALDYAHRQGVVHRDIKPENILLQEGEAMLADFGIAIAVKEAGGNRLTETGLSLGTPQYMSPEQATGDRTLDARSDVYSLAAVLYEMLTGDPPITGKTVQSVIAKLLTEAPTAIRTVRPTVSETVEGAVAKALAKIPADRFASAAEFVRALMVGDASSVFSGVSGVTSAHPAGTHGASAPRSTHRARNIGMMIGAAATLTLLVLVGANGRLFNRKDTSAALKERTQLTFTGRASYPGISADGKQLAYFTKECKGADCVYGVDVQDVGATQTLRVLDGLTAAYGIQWSPDRRNLLVFGTIDGRYGYYVVSVLGGTPRYITSGIATFYSGGDSLLVSDARMRPDSTFLVRVLGLAGGVADSIVVRGPATTLSGLEAIPGSTRFVALLIQPPRGLWQIMERDGRITDQLLNDCTCGGMASRDALWMGRAGPTVTEAIVRVAIDGAGRFATHQDTIYNGRFSKMSVTDDGLQLVVDDGSDELTVFASTFAGLLRGELPVGPPLLQASTPVSAQVSPDGERLTLVRRIPAADGVLESRFTIRPFAGGAESPIAVEGRMLGIGWVDSSSVGVMSHLSEGKSRYSVIDVRTNRVLRSREFSGVRPVAITVLPDGWAWIPVTADRIVIERGAAQREIPKPSWFSQLVQLSVSPDGTRLLYAGWAASTEDTLGVDVVPIDGGAPVRWISAFSEFGNARWLSDGSLLFSNWIGTEKLTLFQVTAPGQVKSLGAVPRRVSSMGVDRELRNVVFGWQESRTDAFVYRVAKP